jgi:pyruvate dehydrogenase phosphatase
MRRAALQVLRLPRRPLPRKSFRHRAVSFAQPGHAVGGLRGYASRRPANSTTKAAASSVSSSATGPSTSAAPSMHTRSLSAALAAAAVAGGAWYLQQKPLHADSGVRDPIATSSLLPGQPSIDPKLLADRPVATARKALVVEQGQLYSGTIVGDGPLSKDTDDYGRKVLEMLTPEQVTQKLRKNEESWLVGRGNGVVRYDVVQIPSNDPIEDDHAEKIIEVPQEVAKTKQGEGNSDWMFWGVFDGHR